MNRRSFLKGAGALTVLVAGGGVWRACDRGVFDSGTGAAYEPWTNWRAQMNEGPLARVRAAILAANAVNSQPWLFKISSSQIELYADTRRNTGVFDPYIRELHISLGCALENLMLAAKANGYEASLTLETGALDGIPTDLKPQLIARIDLAQGKRQDSDLYQAIPHRHTNRFPFDSQKPVPPGFIDELNQAVSDDSEVKLFLCSSDTDRKRVVELIANSATELVHSYPEMLNGSAAYIRDWKATQNARDGLTIDDFGQPPLATALLKFLPSSMAGVTNPLQIKISYTDMIMTGRLLGAIAVRDRFERSQNVRAGRIWQRAHLLATARGLAARPANQAAELVDQERVHGKQSLALAALGNVIGDPAWQTTFMFYMGYATHDGRATVRRPAGDVVI